MIHQQSTIKNSKLAGSFRGISRLGSAFIFLQWFKVECAELSHICTQVTGLHTDEEFESVNKSLIGNRSNRFYLKRL